MREFLKGAAVIALVLTLTGCTFKKMKNESIADLGETEDCGPIDYATINKNLIGPRCLNCHGEGNVQGVMELHTYDLLKARIELGTIQDAVINNRMPKNNPLGNEDKKYLLAWIAQGAPETISETPVEQCRTGDEIEPEPDLLIANYDSIRKHILVSNCLGCHNAKAPGTKAKYDFSTYETMVSYTELFVGAPEKTIFIDAVVNGGMPLFAEALADEEIQVLTKWVGKNLPRSEGDIGLPPPTGPDVDCDEFLDFKKINAEIIQTRCIACHGMFDPVSLDSFADVKNNLSRVKNMLLADKMPPKNPLAPELRDKVIKWIDLGAPESVETPEICTTN